MMRKREATGNTMRATKKIMVPLSQNGNPAIDDGAVLTVYGGCS